MGMSTLTLMTECGGRTDPPLQQGQAVMELILIEIGMSLGLVLEQLLPTHAERPTR